MKKLKVVDLDELLKAIKNSEYHFNLNPSINPTFAILDQDKKSIRFEYGDDVYPDFEEVDLSFFSKKGSKNRKYRNPMSGWDFSKCTHTVERFVSDQGSTIRIDHLREGDSSMGYVRFVNDKYGLSVFGDFGNWIFCRPFIPSKDSYVSVDYWNEKLKIGSKQDHATFDPDETRKEIVRLMSELEDEKSELEDERYFKLVEWYEELLRCVDDELEYTYKAYRDSPDFIDPEDVPFEKKGSHQLLIVFDAFNEICNRLDI